MSKIVSSRPAGRGAATRRKVVDAAERLLRRGDAGFSMRDLAAEAGVSFATPFNQFGGKRAIMHALSARRIDAMEARYADAAPTGDAPHRVLLATRLAVAVMLEEPDVNRVVMGWLGAPDALPGTVWARSTGFWSRALGGGDGLGVARREQALDCLPRQLAIGFRGVLSFWTAGELPDTSLLSHAEETAGTLLLGYADGPRVESGGGPYGAGPGRSPWTPAAGA